MTTTLRIDSSARHEGSVSRLLTDEFLAALQGAAGTVSHRDTASGIPHLDGAWLAANGTPADERLPAQTEALALSGALVDELKAADQIVIGVALYNFAVPSTLKAWIDHVCRAGHTFRYSESGPEGLLKARRAAILLATGGTPARSEIDYASGYLTHIFGFLGVRDVEIIAADRIFADQQAAMTAARARIAEVAARWTAEPLGPS